LLQYFSFLERSGVSIRSRVKGGGCCKVSTEVVRWWQVGMDRGDMSVGFNSMQMGWRCCNVEVSMSMTTVNNTSVSN
jgi:hypothetical protein